MLNRRRAIALTLPAIIAAIALRCAPGDSDAAVVAGLHVGTFAAFARLSGRVPVILSDAWVPPAGIDWIFAPMVDVARDVLAHRAVDGPAVVELEQIFVLDGVVFLLSAIQQRTKIADDFGALLDRFGGEETKPGAGTADAIGFIRGNRGHDD